MFLASLYILKYTEMLHLNISGTKKNRNQIEKMAAFETSGGNYEGELGRTWYIV